jgi:hypothetical protein
MNSILLKNNYNSCKLIKDYKICIKYYNFINPEKIKEKSFSISKNTHGWECIPLHTLNGKIGNKSTIPKEITENNNYLPNKILLKCKYINKILKELNTKIYLVRLMKLKAGGFIAPHIDKYINNKNKIIRCQIPIITNEDIDFIIDNEKHYLEECNLYYINAGEKIHYVKNNSKYDRITLIIDLKPTNNMKNIIYNKNKNIEKLI